jgi:predicted CXXCH cytochrome family protein
LKPTFRILALVLAAASVGFGSWSYRATGRSQTYSATFVGRQSCAACHAEQTHRFTGSHHDLAMDPANDETVVDPSAFDDREFTHFGVTSKFFRRDGKYFVTTEGEDGSLQTFEVKYVFGVDPLQQYMVEFLERKKVRTPQGQEVELPAGRIQVLSIAWDTHGGRWFHLYPKEKIAAGDWLHWTGGGQNWNYMCAECHSTNLQRNYDVATSAYHTTWTEIDVGCEACHGPASEHVARAQSSLGFLDPRHFHSYALNKLKGGSSLGEIETCAPCHSRRRIVHGDYSHGRPFYDFFEAEKIDGNLYFADGQIKEELYEYGSFLQSRMFRENVRCSNCHDPHSLKLKFAGNALCTQCHTTAKYDTPAHHHHQSGSNGAKCVECHMPERTYMEVDPRRDHSIRVPRPDLSAKLGVPNACTQCHAKSAEHPVPGTPYSVLPAEAAAAKIVEWYGPKRAQDPHFGEILEAGRRHDPHAAAGLRELTTNRPTETAAQRAKAVGPIVRASAVALLAGYPDAATRETLVRSLHDAEPLVRVAAVRAIDAWPDDAVRPHQAELLAALADPIRAVRTEAARTLSRVPPDRSAKQEDRDRFYRVLQEWVDGQAATADQPGTHTAIGTMYANLLKATEDMQYVAKAESEFKQALKLEPAHLPTRRNYAALLDLVNRDAEAEAMLKQTLELVPLVDESAEARKQFTAETQYELGWLLFRDPQGTRLADAATAFKASLDAAPDNPQGWQYYGIALLGLNRFSDGAAALERFCSLAPQGAAALWTYAQRAARNEQPDQARTFLEVLQRVDPQAREHYAGFEELFRRVGGR